jgi:hypothetical protein
MAKKKPLSPATLKRKRRKKPIFSDEFIQWHLSTSKHDQCPWCGFKNMGYFGKRERACMNNSCGVSIRRQEPSTEFFNDKIEGEDPIGYRDPDFEVVKLDGGRNVMQAQKESRDGRAMLKIQHGPDLITIYWHPDGHCPEDANGDPVMKIGSAYWYWIIGLTHYGDGCPHWWPVEPLNPLEILARAATDDPVYFVGSKT